MKARPAIVYRLYDVDDQLLYVGCTVEPAQRIKQHIAEKLWWQEAVRATFSHFITHDAARRAEVDAIRTEQPKYNKRDSLAPVALTLEERDLRHESVLRRIAEDRHNPEPLRFFSAQIPLGLLQDFTRIANDSGQSVDALVRSLMREHIDSHDSDLSPAA